MFRINILGGLLFTTRISWTKVFLLIWLFGQIYSISRIYTFYFVFFPRKNSQLFSQEFFHILFSFFLRISQDVSQLFSEECSQMFSQLFGRCFSAYLQMFAHTVDSSCRSDSDIDHTWSNVILYLFTLQIRQHCCLSICNNQKRTTLSEIASNIENLPTEIVELYWKARWSGGQPLNYPRFLCDTSEFISETQIYSWKQVNPKTKAIWLLTS